MLNLKKIVVTLLEKNFKDFDYKKMSAQKEFSKVNSINFKALPEFICFIEDIKHLPSKI